MAKRNFPSRALIIVGLALFIFGLLVILQEKTLFGLVTQLAPSTDSALIFGAVVTSVGQAIVVFAAVKSGSAKLMSNLESERQLTMAVLSRNMEQLQLKIQSDRQAMMAGYAQTMAKLDSFISTQKELGATPQPNLSANCKYCGAKIEQGSFCAKCGRSNR